MSRFRRRISGNSGFNSNDGHEFEYAYSVVLSVDHYSTFLNGDFGLVLLLSPAFLLPCDLQLDSLGATLICISNN